MKNNFSFANKTGTLLSAIVASAFLGLPVLAQSTTPSPSTNAAPSPAAPGRDFPNQSDPRTGQGNLNNGVSTPPTTGGTANEYNYHNSPSQNRPSENRPTENRPSNNSSGNSSGNSQGSSVNQQPAVNQNPAYPKPDRANTSQPRTGQSNSGDSQFRPAPNAIPDPAAPGVRDFPNQADPRTGLPEANPATGI